jgi:vesicle-associated membrane protein 7
VRLQLKHHQKEEKTLYELSGILLQVRGIMLDNIDKVLERGDRLELLVDKTATMEGNTMRFKRQARRFRNTMWWRNVKLTYVLLLLGLRSFVFLPFCLYIQ